MKIDDYNSAAVDHNELTLENLRLKAAIKGLREALEEARKFIAVVECDDGLTTANLCDKIDKALEATDARP